VELSLFEFSNLSIISTLEDYQMLFVLVDFSLASELVTDTSTVREMTKKSIHRMDVKTAALRLGLSPATVYREIKRGAITHRRLGKSRIILEEIYIREYENKRLKKATVI
jgi:hypothetical protein